ncbi:alpha/beta fold hydrolase [Leptolyngbya sp. AN02str]|uniref:alpha/beta fold hydrolase n=1 Tax=Leptolyngbya sp. AN02str TaxID=3423363 RepID=UPI003D3243BC
MPSPFLLHTQVQGAGYPVLCLHGHPGSSDSMMVFTQHLATRFQAIAPDLRGYGQSQTTQPFEMADHLADLEALLDRLTIERCLVLGWSLGGILAMELALKFPERISGLILVATAAYPRGNHPSVGWQTYLLTGVAALINWAYPGLQWNIDWFGRRSLFRYLIQQHTPQTYRYISQHAVKAYLQTSSYANKALNTALRQRYNRLAELSQIQSPCLVLAGAEDVHITAASSLETASAIANCESHCYANVAHLLPWEITQQLLQDIDHWLAAHPEATRPTANAS